MGEWYSSLPERKKVTYGVLFTIISLTLPCYILGFIALAMAPPRFTPTGCCLSAAMGFPWRNLPN